MLRSRAPRRLAAAVAAAGCFVLVGACSNDPVRPPASFTVAADTFAVAALTGTGPNARSAILLRVAPLVASPEGTSSGDYHVVLDINAEGRPVVYPAQLVSSVVLRRTGLRRVDAVFDSLLRAPTDGYQADTALTVDIGQVIAVRIPGFGGECQFAVRSYFYSKVVVDSVRLADRQLFVRATTNPNCGFRSFASGVPRD